MEVIPREFRKLWKEWDLRFFVLFSLTLQIILVILGGRRKYIPAAWIRITVWSAYLVADCIAIFGIGTLSNDLAEIYDDNGSINAKVELTAFWAPFLLLHLGGPDTITAYALEDNNLWLRHFLGLAVQTGGTIYIFLMIWTGSRLSILSIMMILAGFIKYGERVWVLRKASYDQRRDSPPEPGLNYSKLMEEYHLKMDEGYHVMADEVIEVKGAVDLSLSGNDSTLDKEIILISKAYGLFKRFKGLFVDLLLRDVDRDTSRFIFTDMCYKDSFKFIEIELGFMYDLLYTKAAIICSPWGCTCRIISLSLTFSALVIFSLAENHKYDKVDLAITFTLLSVAVLLELYAIILQLFSDRAIVWLCNSKFSFVLRAITSLRLFKSKRWSDSMAQFSLLSFSANQNPTICSKILKLVDQKLEKQLLVNHDQEISEDLKESIFNHIKEKLYEESSGDEHLKRLCTYRGDNILKKFKIFDLLGWSTKVEFDQSILIWHIATELCHYKDIQDEAEAEVEAAQAQAPVQAETEAKAIAIAIIAKAKAEGIAEAEAIAEAKAEAIAIIAKAKPETEAEKFREMSKHLSQYMLYLFVLHPSMLPTGIGQFRFRDTSAEVMSFFAKQTPKSDTGAEVMVMNFFKLVTRNPTYAGEPQAPGESGDSKSGQQLGERTYLPTWLAPWPIDIFRIRKRTPNMSEACNKLLEKKLQLPAFIAEGDRSKSVLFDACKLASQLENIQDTNEKWKMVREVWFEMLTFAASQCSGNNHAQQLRRGGELLTHVWLLMAHLGISEQFQRSEGHVIAKLIVR